MRISMSVRYALHTLIFQGNEGQGYSENDEDGRRGINLWRHREADHRVNLYRESNGVGAARKKGDNEIVEAEREGEQRACH